MDSVFDSYLDGTIEADDDIDDIPKTNDPVWILGKKYNALQGLWFYIIVTFKQLNLYCVFVIDINHIRRDVESKLWCTYRRGFVPIGTSDNGLTTDKGWGCMLRCGQMVLAQAMIDLHLGREWYWTNETRDETYLKIVSRFEDSRKSPFSIHQIALMGDSEDKRVGEWFGPNTVAQVLK